MFPITSLFKNILFSSEGIYQWLNLQIKHEYQVETHKQDNSMSINTNSKHSCLLCDKSFISQLQLKIHYKFTHKKPTHQNNQNINSSDISDDQEQHIKRFRELAKKQIENTSGQVKNLEHDEAGVEPNNERQFKTIFPGKFNDPSLQKNAFKKIYLCGCSQKVFENSDSLTLHISKQHNGFPPEGTLYGVCRDLVIRQFQPVQQKLPIIRPFIEKAEFVCGCGLSYVRQSSLKNHIKISHQGLIPLGTIGLPKNVQKELRDQKQTSNNKEPRPNCTACFQNLSSHYWICDSCEEWRICGSCIESQQKLKEHQNKGHKIRKIQQGVY